MPHSSAFCLPLTIYIHFCYKNLALPYVKKTDKNLLLNSLMVREMGEGLAQQSDDLKSLQRFMLLLEAFLFILPASNSNYKG